MFKKQLEEIKYAFNYTTFNMPLYKCPKKRPRFDLKTMNYEAPDDSSSDKK